jgi:hypothetical protein
MRLALVAIAAAGFTLAAAPAFAVTVETKFSPEFQKKLDKDLGVREGRVLSESLSKQIVRTFEKKGVQADHVVVTIDDAVPNRPTIGQVSNKLGLDPIRSIGVGGAKLTGSAYDASGKEIASLSYDWYETDISQVRGYATWTDAENTFSKFANRFAKKVG